MKRTRNPGHLTAREKYRRLLVTPVVHALDVPLLAWNVGVEGGWHWEPGACPDDESCVYFGRAPGVTKIGFSTRGCWRLYEQKLEPLLFIVCCDARHERRLHSLFSAERVREDRELFVGSRVDAFVAAARERSRGTVGDYPMGAYFRPAKVSAA